MRTRVLTFLMLLVAAPVLAQTAAPAPAPAVTKFPFKAGDKGWGYLGADGKPVIAPAWQRAMPFSEGLAAVKRDNVWGFVGEDGAEKIAPQFAAANDFHDGRALVERRPGTFAGWIDPSGALVLDAAKLDLVRGEDFSEGLALAVARSRLTGFVDPSGAWVVRPQLASATHFSGGRAYVTTQDGKAGFIDRSGKLVIELPATATTGFFHEDLVYVHQPDDKHVFLRPDGAVAFEVPAAADDKPGFGEFSEGRAAYRVKDRWGFIDATGAVIVKPKYNAVLAYSGGLAAVWDEQNHAGFIDPGGKVVIKPQYTDAQSFKGGLARVEKTTKGKAAWSYVNAKGKVVARAE
jgi:hypothetical protein